MWSREALIWYFGVGLGDYQQDWLDQHLEEGNLFEYWSHEACFLPIESFGRYRHQMLKPDSLGWKYNQAWLKENTSQVKHILKHIEKFGACRSADFERTDGKSGGWWEWKPEKRSLEVLFTTGQVMVARRQKFQRVYDLTERVHPAWNDQRDLGNLLNDQRTQVLDAVKALGICKGKLDCRLFSHEKISANTTSGSIYTKWAYSRKSRSNRGSKLLTITPTIRN